MIDVEGLTKVYRGGKGVHGVSFHVREGEAFGFLGPNGAGKTTTIRLLMGFIRAQAGSAFIHGWNCWKEATRVKEVVGYLPGEISLLERMSGEEFLNLIEGMHDGLPEIRKRKAILQERWDLEMKQPIRKMSKGMKQKLGIIAAFMPDPKVFILDEPTSGLDPLMQRTFVEMILEEKSRGKTIFMSSHMFPEIERTCDRVGIIRDGKLATVADIADLRRSQRRILEVEVGSLQDAATVEQNISQAEGLNLIDCQNCHFTVAVSGSLNPLLEILARVNVKEFNFKAADLEEIFMQFYQ